MSKMAVKAFDTASEPPNAQWFLDAYHAGFRLYIAHGTFFGTNTPFTDLEALFGQALDAGLMVAIYTRDLTEYTGAIQAAGRYLNQVQFFAIDVETSPGIAVTRAIVDDVRAHGVRPIIYTGSGMWPGVMGSNANAFADIPLWDTNSAAIDYSTWIADMNSPAPVQYGGWNTPTTMRIGIQQRFDYVLNGVDVDLNSFDASFLTVGTSYITPTLPVVGATNWATPLNTAITNVIGKVNTHSEQITGLIASSGNGLSPIPPVRSTITAAYSTALVDANNPIDVNSSTAITVTIPANATVPYALNTRIILVQYGTGQVTIAGAGGVTLRSPNGFKSSAQYATVTATKRATDEWIVSGSTTV